MKLPGGVGDTPLRFPSSGGISSRPSLLPPPLAPPLSGEGEWGRPLLPDLSLLVKGPGEVGLEVGVVGVERVEGEGRETERLGKGEEEEVGSEFL